MRTGSLQHLFQLLQLLDGDPFAREINESRTTEIVQCLRDGLPCRSRQERNLLVGKVHLDRHNAALHLSEFLGIANQSSYQNRGLS